MFLILSLYANCRVHQITFSNILCGKSYAFHCFLFYLSFFFLSLSYRAFHLCCVSNCFLLIALITSFSTFTLCFISCSNISLKLIFSFSFSSFTAFNSLLSKSLNSSLISCFANPWMCATCVCGNIKFISCVKFCFCRWI